MKRLISLDKVKYSFYVLTHPSDGFYEIRHRERGSVLLALIYVIIFSFSFSMNRISASFIVNDTDPRTVDSVNELMGVALMFLLVSVGNWSITCLMEGEGRFKDIITILGYSMIPMIVTIIPGTLISQFVAADEETFYFIFIGIGIAWSAILALIGIMTIHNYSMAKTLLTLILTFVAVLIIIFILMMLGDLFNRVYGFFHSIYVELSFRT